MTHLKKIFNLYLWEYYILLAALVWTIAIFASYFWTVHWPFAPVLELGEDRLQSLAAGHFLLWIAGIGGIYFGASRFRRSEDGRLCAEEHLKRSLELSSIVLESTQDAICVIDAAEYTIIKV